MKLLFIRVLPLITFSGFLIIYFYFSFCIFSPSETIHDTSDRFSYKVSKKLVLLESDDTMNHYYLEKEKYHCYVVAENVKGDNEAVEFIFNKIGLSYGEYIFITGSLFGDWTLKVFISSLNSDDSLAIFYQYKGNTIYAVNALSENQTDIPGELPSSIMNIVRTFRFKNRNLIRRKI